MASQTSFLELLLPELGEYRDTWHEPLNDNLTKIDVAIDDVTTEVIDARQGKTSLLAFLQVAHENDGTLKPTTEVRTARNSPVYGHRDPVSSALFGLKERIAQADKEIWKAREVSASILDAMAFRQFGLTNMILTGTKDINGYPMWLSPSGSDVIINGSATAINLLIDGKLAKIRTQENLTISGAAGVKYVYALYQSAGVITVDGDSSTPPPATANGSTSADVNSEMTIFTDVTQDFTTEDVQPGDLLTILNGGDAGEYIIKEIAPVSEGSNVTQLKIVGLFPVGGLSSINYTITNRHGVTFGFDTTETPAAGKIYIGEADYDGVAVTAVRARHFKDLFVGEWRAIDVTSPTTFENIYQHGLGSDNLEISVQASQANDGSLPVEELSVARIDSTLSFVPSNGSLTVGVGTLDVDNSGLSITAVQLSVGDQTVTSQPALSGDASVTGTPALTGTVGGSLSGDVKMSRSVVMNWDNNKVRIKNAHAGVFYKDYNDVVRTSGYLRVVVRRRS